MQLDLRSAAIGGIIATLALAHAGFASTPAPTLAKPDASNTGFTSPEASLTLYSGSFTTSSDGQVISGYKFTSHVDVEHDNVTFTDCLFASGSYLNADDQHAGSTDWIENLYVDYCTFDGSYAAVVNATVQNCEFTNWSGSYALGLRHSVAWDCIVASNWFHHSGATSWGSCLSLLGITDTVVNGNYFNPRELIYTDCIRLYGYGGSPVHSVSITENWLMSGHRLLDIQEFAPNGAVSRLNIDENRVGTNYTTLSDIDSGVSFTQSGNVWDATGLPASF